MPKQPLGNLATSFANLPDPRTGKRRDHLFLEIVAIAICAVICGAEGWTDVAAFGKAKRKWLKRFLTLPHGTQARRMTPLGACLGRWMRKRSRPASWNGSRRYTPSRKAK